MAHISLPPGLPGITGLFAFRPQSAGALGQLANALLRDESPLSRGDRELIAAYVSRLNDCHFCHTSHATFAALQLEDGWSLVDAVMEDPATPRLRPVLRALLSIAASVQKGGKHVTDAQIALAREAGASDVEIHDTVLIAAAFCMFNRYVDGLATFAPPNREDYAEMGQEIVRHGYVR